MRANAFVGFPLGGLLSLAIMAGAVPVLQPASIRVSHLNQVALPEAAALGKAGMAIVFVSFFAAAFAAAAESALSSRRHIRHRTRRLCSGLATRIWR